MTKITFRQVKVMVDSGLLPHLALDSLQEVADRTVATLAGDLENQFPGESVSSDELEATKQALSKELTMRGRPAI